LVQKFLKEAFRKILSLKLMLDLVIMTSLVLSLANNLKLKRNSLKKKSHLSPKHLDSKLANLFRKFQAQQITTYSKHGKKDLTISNSVKIDS
jgi:hypothetical protein